ncbi:MAG: dihydrodipicolinate synthase family protein [Christensenellales bacterium]|jgi:dihydrodipicolinate synthase/N-acetylneuraminate lyase
MKAKEINGIIPPIQTAFTKDGDIYEQGIRNLIRFTLPHVHAYFPIGTYGVGPLMTQDERKKVLEIQLDEINGKVPVIAHVGATSTREAVALAQHAKSAGAAAVAAISPYYSPGLPEDMLFGHFASLVDAVADEDFPVFIYNNPHYCQNTVTPAFLKRLADYGVAGCKEATFDLVNFYKLQEAVLETHPDFSMIVGTEAIFIGAYDAGADGCVCGMGNIYPEVMRKMHDQYFAGDRKGAIESQRLILKIRSLTKLGPTIPIMHAILDLRGVDAGFPRKPYTLIDNALKEKIKAELQALKLL